ncbi:YqaA family protein [Shewanella sp.]|uniref:YqaA family protein n=1 Tax=Shewanella sp. TaxID=50422 RepID=UPI004054722A
MEPLSLMFSGAFMAATVLPGGSELLLFGFLTAKPQAWVGLLIAASLGNTLGAMTSYALGRAGRKAITPEKLASKSTSTSLNWLERYGYWALLLSWLPVIGDILCLLAGWLKLPLLPSSLMMLIGKTLRYGVFIGLFFGGSEMLV